MSLIGSYDLSGEGLNFTVTFDMPDNCICKKVTSGGENRIEVSLPAGSLPSPTMVSKQFDFVGGLNSIVVQFKQTAQGITEDKPKLTANY